MGLSSIYNRIALISPYCEIALRHLYWKNVKWLGKFNPNKPAKSSASGETKHVDFEKVIDWLKAKGVGDGSLLIVHSSYAGLECTGLNPEEIVDKLLNLVGPTGTLCMPVIRKFKGEPKASELLTTNIDDLVCTYDVKWTKITSGLLPYCLMRKENAVVSHFPFNPMCAVGPLAEEMMAHNLDGELPSPHGPNSSWKFCYDHNAAVCWLGTDLEHHNTMTHVAEEAFNEWRWRDSWYHIRKFKIIDESGNETNKEVHERKPEWGMLRYAEMNVNRDLKRNNIVDTEMLEGIIPLGFENSRTFVDYLRSKNKKGYPYYKLF